MSDRTTIYKPGAKLKRFTKDDNINDSNITWHLFSRVAVFSLCKANIKSWLLLPPLLK